MIHPGNMQRGGVRQSADDTQTLEVADYEAIRDKARYVTAISPSVNSGGQSINGNNNYPSTVYGITPDYLDIRKVSIADGEMFTEQDIKSAAKVCLLGQTVIDNLFPDGSNPIGRIVRFNKIPMKVVGTLTPQRNQLDGYGSGRRSACPIHNGDEANIGHRSSSRGLFASAIDEEYTDQAIDEITEILREQHKPKEGADDDFDIRPKRTQRNAQLDLRHAYCTARMYCRHLPVGRRYRHNEYNVCVRHRAHTRDRTPHVAWSTRYRYSVAIPYRSCNNKCHRRYHRSDTWHTRLLGVNIIMHWPVSVQVYSMVLSFVVCTVTGVFFGWYPAKKAARLIR